MNDYENKDGIHIEPYSLLKDIILNLWVVILAALIGLMSVTVWNQSVHTPQYTSTATLLVNIRNSAAYSYTNLSSSSEMAEIFTEVFKQSTMRQYAAAQLGKDRLEGTVSTSVLDNTNIFTVSVTSPSPETSYKELCAILEVYPQISESVFSDSVIDIMRSPNLPSSPSNSISNQNKKLTVIACSGIVLAAIVYLSVMRDTIKDEASFKKKVAAKLFGTVPHEPSDRRFRYLLTGRKSSLLISNAYASYRFTETFNKLANRFEYLQRTDNAKVFLITSIAENEGKSTTIANIALALAAHGKKVALLDMDFKKPAIHKIFDLPASGNPDFAHLLAGKIGIHEFQFIPYRNTGVYLAVNEETHGNYVNWIHDKRVADIFDYLRNIAGFDYVLIDTPPVSAAADVTTFMRFADKSLLVIRTDYVYTADINDAILSIHETTDNFVGCIFNDVHREFSFLGQLGLDETGHYGRHSNGYHRYDRYAASDDNEKN